MSITKNRNQDNSHKNQFNRMNRKIAFFYHDPVQKETQENVALEADQRDYQTEFVDIAKTFYTDVSVGEAFEHKLFGKK